MAIIRASYAPNTSTNYGPVFTPAPAPKPQIPGSGYTTDFASNPTNYNQQTSAPAPVQTMTNPEPTAPSGPSPEEIYMNFLNQQYDAGNNSINEMEAGLGGQKASMETIADNTYNQGFNSQTTAYDTNKGDLESYQAKSLQDIGDNLRAMWGQGSRVLGSRGAADSSAAGQYNYAISKLGSKQRGDVMQDVSRRLGNLKSTYDTNVANLNLEKNTQIQQISQWYAEAQNSIRGMRAELQQQKSEQALNVAMQMLNEAKQQATNRQSILDSWAVNKAQSLPELQGMLNQNSQGLRQVGSLGAGLNFGGTSQNVNNPGFANFGNQDQDSVNWLQRLMGGQ